MVPTNPPDVPEMWLDVTLFVMFFCDLETAMCESHQQKFSKMIHILLDIIRYHMSVVFADLFVMFFLFGCQI